MKNDYKENDAERAIFRAALGGMQIEPSEKFWNSALHSIIDREKALARKSTGTWKTVSFFLGAGIILFCIHDMWTYNKMNKIEQEVAAIKNSEPSSVIKENTVVTISKSNVSEEANSRIASSTGNSVIKNSNTSVPANKAFIKTSVGQILNKGNQYALQQVFASGASTSVSNSPATQNIPNEVIVAGQGNNPVTNQSTVFVNNEGSKVTVASGNVSEEPNKINTLSTKNNSKVVIAKQQDSSQVSTKQTTSDSGSGLLAMNEPPKPKINVAHKFSVSAFFAPGGISDFLEDRDNDNTDGITVNSLKDRETDLFSYEAGIKMGLDISNKFSIHAGLYYYMYTYNIKQSIITAQMQHDGSVGYSIVTSSGVVEMPYYAAPLPKVGDSIKVHGNSSRGYLGVPIELSYNAITHNKLGVYLLGGFSANIIHDAVTNLSWQNTLLQDGNASVQNVQGLALIDFSYDLGFGVTYKLWRGISVYVEPYLQGSITSISKNAPITIYPYFLGCAGGVTYHF